MKFSRPEQRILNDNRSGSSEILNSTLRYNLQYLTGLRRKQTSIDHLILFNDHVIRKFMSMTMVANGLSRAKLILTGVTDKDSPVKDVIDKIRQLIKEIAEIDKLVIRNCRSLFKRKITVATYSNSGLVKSVIGHYRTRIREVYISESRPAGEGKEAALSFSKAGINVMYMVDAHLPEMLGKVDLLLLGADSVGERIFANKIGSTMLLKTARSNMVRSVVVFESLKLTKDEDRLICRDDYDRREIWPDRLPKNIDVRNSYFETIPNKLVDLFISDKGADSSKSLRRAIRSLHQ